MNTAFFKLAARGTLAGFFVSLWLLGTSAGRTEAADERGAKDMKPFVFHSVLTNGKRAGDLFLGQTTFDEVLRMYPAPPFHDYDGNLRPVASPSLEGYPAVKYVYNPWQTMYALFFDGQKRLVMVSELYELGSLTEKELLKRYPFLAEANGSESIEYQAEVQECVSLIAHVETKGRTVEQLTYAYTCE